MEKKLNGLLILDHSHIQIQKAGSAMTLQACCRAKSPDYCKYSLMLPITIISIPVEIEVQSQLLVVGYYYLYIIKLDYRTSRMVNVKPRRPLISKHVDVPVTIVIIII